MLRRLFACLALLTGLAAAGAPAQAHHAEAEIARIEAGLCQADGESMVATKAVDPMPRAPAKVGVRTARPLVSASLCIVPTVRPGIDRARE